MKKILFVTAMMLALISCRQNVQETNDNKRSHRLVPMVKEIHYGKKMFQLPGEALIYAAGNQEASVAKIFTGNIHKLTGVEFVATGKVKNASITFKISENLEKEEYRISSGRTTKVTGGSAAALSMASMTLLQLISFEDGIVSVPGVEIDDWPDASYRGLMIDLARQWHPADSIRKLIDMAAFYKTNYLHLHFSDYQSYTLPSASFPTLSSEKRRYTFDELKELEEYSQERGVTIVPEIDIPGHSSQFTNKYPEIFAIRDMDKNPWIINMGRERAYSALDTIIGEICDIFPSTPYIHIGGDEAIFEYVTDDPEAVRYMMDNNIEPDAHELYRHFITRMNDIVKKHGKQMCVWEGFRPDGKIEIPDDILVFEYETNRFLPGKLIENGYSVINASWKPLYVVNRKKWSPETIYEWNMWRWDNWYAGAPSWDPIQVEKSDLVKGAEMCAWEQPASSEFPSLRERLPVMNERIWNTEKRNDEDGFFQALRHTNAILSRLVNDSRRDSLLHGYEFPKQEKPK